MSYMTTTIDDDVNGYDVTTTMTMWLQSDEQKE